MASCFDRKELQNCPVCLEHFRYPRKLPKCRHVFCESCITDTIGKLKTRGDAGGNENENESGFPCPLCRVLNHFPGNTEDLSTWVSTLEMAEEEEKEVEMTVENMEDCMPCKKLNKSTRAVKYCLDCRESLCAQCFEETQKFTTFQGHVILEIKRDDKKNERDVNQTLATYMACKQHPDKSVSYICEIHDELCCQTCVVSKHRQCDKVTELQQHVLKSDLEQDSNKSAEPINESVSMFIDRCQNIIKDIKDNAVENKVTAKKIDQSLRDIRGKVNQLFDRLEENISQESKGRLKEESLSNDTFVHDIEETIGKLKLSCILLENAIVKEDRTLEYVIQRRILDLLSESETHLIEICHTTKRFGLKLEPSSILSDFIDVNETTQLAALNLADSGFDLTKHARRYKITKIGTYQILAAGDYPVFSGLVYSPNKTLVLVDSNYGILYLVSETFKNIATCNCTIFNTGKNQKDIVKKPFCITFLCDGIVAASVPNKKTMLNIKTNGTLKIQSEIDVLRAANAVVGLNNGDIAVSWTEPVAFGVLSCKFFHPEEKIYLRNDKSGRVLKSFDYMAVDQRKMHVIQPCTVDKAVFCFDFQGNPQFEYKHTELKQPAGVGIDTSGNVYICDTVCGTIHIISANGYPITIHKEDSLERPLALAFDKKGTTFAVTQRSYFGEVNKRKEACVFQLSN